jgi:hypothetical protein
MNQQKAKFRDALELFSKSQFKLDLGKLSHIQRSNALLLCYIQKVRNVLLPGSLPDEIEELNDCIVDGKNDRNVDFLHRQDGLVTIIQVKYHSPGATENPKEFVDFQKVISKLCPETGESLSKNKKLRDMIDDIDFETDSFCQIFLSLTKPHPDIRHHEEDGVADRPGTPLKDLAARTELRYLSEDDINMEYRDAESSRSGVEPTVELRLSKSGTQDGDTVEFINDAGKRSVIGLIAAGQICSIYERHREKLFNLNIRNYVGDTRTNKDIVSTALKEPENFFFYNNGVSAIARKVESETRDGRTTLKCSDFSIINGAQTFKSIFKAHKRGQGKTDELKVLLRVSEVDYRRTSEGEFLDRITRYNNTQNSMKLSDFRSNDRVQVSIQKYMERVHAYGGKSYVYRAKRTDRQEKNKIVVGLEEYCRTVFSFVHGPADMHGGLGHLFDPGPDKGYERLFGDPNEPLPEEKLNEYMAIWLVCSNCDTLLKAKKAESDGNADDDSGDSANLEKLALERKYLVYYAMGEIMREMAKRQKRTLSDFLKMYAKPTWQDDKRAKKLIQRMFEAACDLVVFAYRLTTAKHENFVHRNFFRSQETLQLIHEGKAQMKSAFARLDEDFLR